MEAIQAELIAFLAAVITACVINVARHAAKFLKEKFSTEQLNRSKKYAEIAVQFVEQIGEDLNSKEKFNRAKKQLVIILEEHNIKISEEEIDALIETMVAEMNRSFKEEWKVS